MELCPSFKEELMPVLHVHVYTQDKAVLPNSWGHYYPDTKTKETISNYKSVSLTNMDVKILKKWLWTDSAIYKKL